LRQKNVYSEQDIPRNLPSDSDASSDSEHGDKGRLPSLLITLAIVVTGSILAAIYKQEINDFGVGLITRFGQGWVDFGLFLITAVSCTPLVLPVWGYVLAGIAMGYNVIRLASVMAFGSTLGSFTTFLLGKYFSQNAWVKKKFPKLLSHPWSQGKSKSYVSWILFLGTASPIPCDVFYAACGAKRFPSIMFLIAVGAGRFVRYLYMGCAFKYFSEYF